MSATQMQIRQLVHVEVARTKYLGGISKTAMYGLLSRGELKRVKIGKRSFVTGESINAYIDRLEAEA